MVEMVYSNLHDNQMSKELDEIHCTQAVWWRLVWNTMMSYANTLAMMDHPDTEELTVEKPSCQLQQFKENLSSPFTLRACVLAVVRLSRQVQRLKENLSSSLPLQASISAIKGAAQSQPSPV